MKNINYFIALGIFVLFSCKEKSTEKYDEINFSNLKFEDLLAEADKTDKLIFIDCYTSWCAPCKWMDKNVFNKKDVYEFYNASFINAKIDMEKGEGPDIGKRYGVSSYPTYIFLNGKGELVHKATSKMSTLEFINEGKNALDPNKAFGILSKKYQSDELSNDEIVNYAISLNKMRAPKTDTVLTDLLAKVDNNWLLSDSGWRLINNFVYDDSSQLFDVLDANRNRYVDLAGRDAVNQVYQKALQRNMYASSRNQNEALFLQQLDSLKKLTDEKRDIAIMHSGFYVNSNDAKKFIETSNYYVDNYLANDPETIAFIARSASFRSKENDSIMEQAARLISKAYKMDPNNYGTVGTYAEIQNNIGNKKEALQAAELAVKMADTISSKVKKRALENLDKIKNE